MDSQRLLPTKRCSSARLLAVQYIVGLLTYKQLPIQTRLSYLAFRLHAPRTLSVMCSSLSYAKSREDWYSMLLAVVAYEDLGPSLQPHSVLAWAANRFSTVLDRAGMWLTEPEAEALVAMLGFFTKRGFPFYLNPNNRAQRMHVYTDTHIYICL